MYYYLYFYFMHRDFNFQQ